MGGQWAAGNQNVQIHGAVGSSIQISFEGRRREVPLEPAVVPVGERVRSPARLLRARSGVVPTPLVPACSRSLKTGPGPPAPSPVA